MLRLFYQGFTRIRINEYATISLTPANIYYIYIYIFIYLYSWVFSCGSNIHIPSQKQKLSSSNINYVVDYVNIDNITKIKSYIL